MSGALCAYISDKTVTQFQPMGCNMGLLPPLEELVKDKQRRYQMLAERGIAHLRDCLKQGGYAL